MNLVFCLYLAIYLPGLAVSWSNPAGATPTAAARWLVGSPAGDHRRLLAEELDSDEYNPTAVAEEAVELPSEAAEQVAAAGLCKAGYKAAGKLCGE
jgi:hypothetical protein